MITLNRAELAAMAIWSKWMCLSILLVTFFMQCLLMHKHLQPECNWYQCLHRFNWHYLWCQCCWPIRDLRSFRGGQTGSNDLKPPYSWLGECQWDIYYYCKVNGGNYIDQSCGQLRGKCLACDDLIHLSLEWCRAVITAGIVRKGSNYPKTHILLLFWWNQSRYLGGAINGSYLGRN